jgi:hypothetical protein
MPFTSHTLIGKLGKSLGLRARPHWSSCAASFSMSCPKASIRFAISACGTPLDALPPPMRACCCPSSVVSHQPKLLATSPTPTTTLKSPIPPTHTSVRAAVAVTSCSYASCCQNGLRPHDPFASPINPPIRHRVRCMPRIAAVLVHLPNKPSGRDPSIRAVPGYSKWHNYLASP